MAVVKCGECKMPLQGPADAKPSVILTCPTCGRQDTLKVVQAEIIDFVKHRTAAQFGDAVKKATRGSKYVKYKPAPRSAKRHRYIVD